MDVLQQGGTSSPTNPVLPYVYIEERVAAEPLDDAGFTADVESLTYRVVKPDGTEHTATTAVDLDDAPTGDRTDIGTYAPTIVIASNDPVGNWRVEWVAQRVLTDAFTLSKVTKFRVVLQSETIPDGYALPSDLKAQGLPDKFCRDSAELAQAIEDASRYIDRITQRFFEPRFLKIQRDGAGRGILAQFDDPIIGVEDVSITFSDFRPLVRILDRTELRIYNRHMRDLLSPDDRNSPRIEVLGNEEGPLNQIQFPALHRRFTQAQQNVQVEGWFGYTDPNGSPLGVTPREITRVTMMLVMREIRPLWEDFSDGRNGGTSGPIMEEHTRDQRVKYASGKDAGAMGAGWITGDPRIDLILSKYMGPVKLAAV